MKNTDGKLAAKYHTTDRAIRRWRREGAPLNDPKAMLVWLAGRRTLPPGTQAMLARSAQRALKDIPPEADGTPGAAAALRRLELAEATAHGIFERTRRLGNALETKNAEELWLRIGDSLRKYDLMIDRNRRMSGEVISRAEVEDHVRHFIRYLKIAIVGSVSRLAQTASGLSPGDWDELLRGALLDDVLSTLGVLGARATPMRLPDWFIKAACGPMGDALESAQGTVDDRIAATEDFLRVLAECSTDERKRHLSELRGN